MKLGIHLYAYGWTVTGMYSSTYGPLMKGGVTLCLVLGLQKMKMVITSMSEWSMYPESTKALNKNIKSALFRSQVVQKAALCSFYVGVIFNQ